MLLAWSSVIRVIIHCIQGNMTSWTIGLMNDSISGIPSRNFLLLVGALVSTWTFGPGPETVRSSGSNNGWIGVLLDGGP